MKDIESVSKVVERILREKEHTRGSDAALYREVCRHYNPVACDLPFVIVMEDPGQFDLPKTETVRRSRQRLQELHKELRPCKEVEDGRYENYKAVLEYISK